MGVGRRRKEQIEKVDMRREGRVEEQMTRRWRKKRG